MSSVVELLPGLLVNYAPDGQVWLGVPFGTDAYVATELRRQMEDHDKRQRGIAAYADCNGGCVSDAGVRLSRQLALVALKFSANARDVHFLRALGRRAVGEAAALHDAAVLNTLAVVLGQAAPPAEGEPPLCHRPLTAATDAFQHAADWLRLPTAMSLRPWAQFGDAAYVSMWAQAYNSARISFGGVQVCAFPALVATIESAAALAAEDGGGTLTAANALGWDLAQAWERLTSDTRAAFPSPAQRRAPDDPAYWLTETCGEVYSIGRLTGKVQKRLSAGPALLQRRNTAALMHESRAPGYSERREYFDASLAFECGKPFRAQPWIDAGDMHWGNTDFLVATALRFCLDMPAQVVPRQHCPCDWHGEEAAPAAHTAELRALTSAAHRDWARHAVSSCPKGAGPRGIVHDDIADVFVVLLKNAGFVGVEYEDAWWDAGAAYEDSDHRRPDITARHPVTGVKYVFDVVVWWGASQGLDEWGGGKAGGKRERWKRRRYDRAMWARYVEQLTPEEAVAWADGEVESELDWGLVECPHVFVPLGFEAGGCFGPATRDFLREVARVAGAQASADLYHWSAMVWGEHWEQRLGVKLAQGEASLVLGAVATARANAEGSSGRKASPEWSSTDCQPSVNL